MDEIEETEGSDSSSCGRNPLPDVPPPLILKGTGEITVFGVCCKYENSFPHQLTGRLAPEEFTRMIDRINAQLKRNIPAQVKKYSMFKNMRCFSA